MCDPLVELSADDQAPPGTGWYRNPVVFMTAIEDEALEREAVAAGCIDVSRICENRFGRNL